MDLLSVLLVGLKRIGEKTRNVFWTWKFNATGYTNLDKGVQMMPNDTFLLDRLVFTDLSTIGNFLIDGDIFCKTLELSCRKANAEGKMAITPGRYELAINKEITTDKEKKFGFTIIQVLNVPNRTNIEIHPANWATELKGCIAPGMRSDIDAVYDSRNAFFKLKDETLKRLGFGKVYIQICGGT